MSLQINEREREGITILDLNGSLILEEPESDLRKNLQRLREAGKINVALNLQDVSIIDSTGLGTLVIAHVKLRKAGGSLVLFNLNSSHMTILSLTKLVTAFDLFGDEQDAVNSCFPDRTTKHYDILSFLDNEGTAAVPS